MPQHQDKTTNAPLTETMYLERLNQLDPGNVTHEAKKLFDDLRTAPLSSAEKIKLLKQKTKDGCTLGMFIARYQDAATTQQFLTYLKELNLTKDEVLVLLKQQHSNGWTLGMFIARYQDAATTQQFLTYLNELNLTKDEVLVLLKQQHKEGWALGMHVARYHDAATTQQFLTYLRELNLTKDEALALLKQQDNKAGWILGMFIAHYQDAATIKQFLDYILSLVENGLPIDKVRKLFEVKNNDNLTFESSFKNYQDKLDVYLTFKNKLYEFELNKIKQETNQLVRDLSENKFTASQLPEKIDQVSKLLQHRSALYASHLNDQRNMSCMTEDEKDNYSHLIRLANQYLNYTPAHAIKYYDDKFFMLVYQKHPEAAELQEVLNIDEKIKRYVAAIAGMLHNIRNEIDFRSKNKEWGAYSYIFGSYKTNTPPKLVKQLLASLNKLSDWDQSNVLATHKEIIAILENLKQSKIHDQETKRFYATMLSALKSIMFSGETAEIMPAQVIQPTAPYAYAYSDAASASVGAAFPNTPARHDSPPPPYEQFIQTTQARYPDLQGAEESITLATEQVRDLSRPNRPVDAAAYNSLAADFASPPPSFFKPSDSPYVSMRFFPPAPQHNPGGEQSASIQLSPPSNRVALTTNI